MNSTVFLLWNIEKGHGVNPFKEGAIYLWHQLQNDLFTNGNHSSLFKWEESADLSDDPFFVLAFEKQMIVIDLRDPLSPQHVLKIKVSHRIRHIRLSKNNSQDRALFYTSINKIVCRNYGLKKTKMYFKGHTQGVFAFDTSYDNRLLFSTGEDLTLRLWDISTGEQLDCVHTLNIQSKLRFAPNHRFIAAFSRQEDRAYLWEVRDSKLKLLSFPHKELECNRANFENLMDMDEENKKLFKQLGGLNIHK